MKCFFKDNSFNLFERPPVGYERRPDQENLLRLLVIIAYDTNKILKQSHGGSLKKNKKNKKSQKKM